MEKLLEISPIVDETCLFIEFNVTWRRIRQELFQKELFLTSVASIAPTTGSGDHAVGLAVMACKYVSGM